MKKGVLSVFLGLVIVLGGLNASAQQEQSLQERMAQVQRTLLENGVSSRIVAKILQNMADAEANRPTLEFEALGDSWAEIMGTEGASNTFYGTSAGNTTMTGTHNSFFGNLAGYKNKGGASNAFFGRAAGYNNTSGSKNTFIGRGAGQSNTTASSNIFVGYTAGYSNTTGGSNTFIGNSAGCSNASGYYNVIVGESSGNLSTGSYNTFVGQNAGNKNTGSENVMIGDFAGRDNTGSNNVFIGNEAGQNAVGSNQLYIGNQSSNCLIYGNFADGHVGINNTSPGYAFVVGTNGAYCDGGVWFDGSSREYKEDILALTTEEAVQAFNKLEPVKYKYKENKDETYLGFIAEDVPDLVATNERKGLSPMDMVAVLTKVVQEQMMVNQEQQKEISELKEKIAKLENQSRKER